MLRSMCAALAVVVLLGGCTVRGPTVEVDPGGVEIRPVTVRNAPPGPPHCPPGHAMKGWC